MNVYEKQFLITIQRSNSGLQFPVKTKAQVLHIFENRYLLPSQIVNNLHLTDALVVYRFKQAFNMVGAIQGEIGQEPTDHSNIYSVREKFKEGLLHVLHAYIGSTNLILMSSSENLFR